MNRGTLAERVMSITRTGTRSPGGSGRNPRSSPGAEDVGCPRVHVPPGTSEPMVQSSARRSM